MLERYPVIGAVEHGFQDGAEARVGVRDPLEWRIIGTAGRGSASENAWSRS